MRGLTHRTCETCRLQSNSRSFSYRCFPVMITFQITDRFFQFEYKCFPENAVYMFSYSNSWFNIIVFAYFRDDLRRSFARMLKTSCCVRMHPSRIFNRDTLSTGSARSDEQELEQEPERDSQTGSEPEKKAPGQDNTLIMMEF